jgi:hypothetical protein
MPASDQDIEDGRADVPGPTREKNPHRFAALATPIER